MINISVLAKLIAYKFGCGEAVARVAAEEMLRDDFPKNGITTVGGAIVYLDYVKGLVRPREA